VTSPFNRAAASRTSAGVGRMEDTPGIYGR
jgi:hypothetical protein